MSSESQEPIQTETINVDVVPAASENTTPTVNIDEKGNVVENVEEPKKEEPKVDEPKKEEPKVEEPKKVEENVVKPTDLDALAKEGLDQMLSRYLADGVIDNNELVDLVQYAMEIVDKKKEISGLEKKKVVLMMLKNFLETRVPNYSQLEKLLEKTIDLGVKVSKDGIEKIKLNAITIADAKSAFNIIYASALTKVNEKYPLADDIVNNVFDIALYVMQILEGQTSLTGNEKKVLMKKILLKLVESLESKLSTEQKEFIISQIDPTINLVVIALRAKDGKLEINPAEVVGFMQCICKCFTRSSKKKSA